jgi:murein DD-endopeptidase MepM/ murein hydrolase activator NlpD
VTLPDVMPPPLAASAYGYGPYDNSGLVALAQRLRSFGRSTEQVQKRVFAPFIIAGPAHWANSWGALRQDPDGTTRRHLGQDVFCDYGAPVLAAEAGTVEFSSDPLGGFVARLDREEGGYFYYAHLSDWNDDRFSSGDRVSVGDVIGYCGVSGNAHGGSPHVHFGYYAGGPRDPMGFLLTWHEQAERRAGRILRRLVGSADLTRLAHRFGEDLIPDLVVDPALEMPYESVEALLEAVVGSRTEV